MPSIAPFQGIRYAAGPSISSLLAPPYDVVNPALREKLAARSPSNVIHLTLDARRPSDRPGDDRYSRAAARLGEWLQRGTLRRDPRPALYPLEQTFVAPDGRQRVRRALLAAVRLHDYAEGIVLPHERTLAAPLADRLELLRQTRANLSPVFALYEDERNEALTAISGAFAADPVQTADTDDGVHHRLWRLEDPAIVEAVRGKLADRKLLIADGHHRYGAALGYRDELDRQDPGLPVDGGHRWVLMALCSMDDPGMVIYPTHRLLSRLPGFRSADVLARLGQYFTVETLSEDIRWPSGRAWAVSRLGEHLGKSSAFLMVTADDQKARILKLREEADLAGMPLPASENLRALDVTVLHGVVFQGLLGMSPESQQQQENLEYVKDAGEAVARTLAGDCQAAFLLNPTPMWQVQAVAESGETMPQKSTWLHPKIPAGLVIRAIDPRGPP